MRRFALIHQRCHTSGTTCSSLRSSCMYGWIRINMQQSQKNLYFVCNLDNYMTKDNWLTDTLNHMDGIWHAWYTFPDSWSAKGEKECRARQIQIYGSRWLTSSAADAVVRTFMTSSHKHVLALAHKYWCLHILTKAKLLPRAAQTLPRAQHVVFHISCCIMDFRD